MTPSENHPKRVGVTITREQHALLKELAELEPDMTIAGFLRRQLDMSTPLLRATVPVLRRAAEERELQKEEAAKLLYEPFKLLKEMGLGKQLELLDSIRADENGSQRSERPSERGREAEEARAMDGDSNG